MRVGKKLWKFCLLSRNIIIYYSILNLVSLKWKLIICGQALISSMKKYNFYILKGINLKLYSKFTIPVEAWKKTYGDPVQPSGREMFHSLWLSWLNFKIYTQSKLFYDNIAINWHICRKLRIENTPKHRNERQNYAEISPALWNVKQMEARH